MSYRKINPYKRLEANDFYGMNVRKDLVVVQALTPKDMGSSIDLGGSFNFSTARVHKIVKTGDDVSVPSGARCLVLANTLDAVDSDNEFCFIEETDIYAWWMEEGGNE